jgi:hypothetical protein
MTDPTNPAPQSGFLSVAAETLNTNEGQLPAAARSAPGTPPAPANRPDTLRVNQDPGLPGRTAQAQSVRSLRGQYRQPLSYR